MIKNNIRQSVIAWSNRFPLDRWWRDKYKVSYLSNTHRESTFFGQYYEYYEDKMFKEYYDEREKSKEIEPVDYVPLKGNWWKGREINKLKRDSEELGRGLIKDARAYTTSGKETLAYIEEQIKAIERRNRAEKQGQLLEVESQKQRGKISPEQYKSQVSQIGFESKTDEQQVTLLRELIDTVKNTSKREIVEDRKGVDKQLTKSKTLEQLAPRGDELKILKETLQRQQLGDVKGQERDEHDRFTGREIGEGVNRAGQMVAGSQNQFFMAAAVAGMIPIVGGAISSIMSRALGAAQGYQTAVGGMSQLKYGGNYYGFGRGLSSIGMTMSESLGLRRKVSEAQGFVISSTFDKKGKLLDEGGTTLIWECY